jgi:hypothetical protein
VTTTSIAITTTSLDYTNMKQDGDGVSTADCIAVVLQILGKLGRVQLLDDGHSLRVFMYVCM